MKRLYSATQIIARILEVAHWAGAAALLVLFVLTLIPGDLFQSMVFTTGAHDVTVDVYGFEVMVADAAGVFSKAAVRVFSLGAAIIMALMAMVFRDIYLCLKTARGKTWFSEGDTPFQANITRMVREIGIFYLAVVVVGFLFGIIARLVLGPDCAEASLNLGGIMVGLLMLCLSQVFSQGTKLRQDVDGLL